MASIAKDKNATRRLLFVLPNGDRKAIRLGAINQKAAEVIKTKVENLLSFKGSNCSWDNETTKWVAEIGDELAAKLAKVELIPPRQRAERGTLADFIRAYIDGRANLKANTKRNYEQTRRYLLEHFGEQKLVVDVTAGDADDWREGLIRQGLSPATISREVKRARQYFRAAIRKKMIFENPLADLPAPAQVNTSREFFVTREMIAKVIDAAPANT